MRTRVFPFALRRTQPCGVLVLEAVFASVASVKLRWTAPGDVGASRRAGQHHLRHALSPLTEETWSGAQRVEGLPTPAAAETAESLLVSGLEMGTTCSFALKATDDALNESALSNVATRSTASLVRLTTSPGGPMQFGAFSPAWSPDGETIAFDADWGSTYPHTDLDLIPSAGGAMTRLTYESDSAKSPTWSSDGSQIAFVASRWSAGHGVHFGPEFVTSPSWSPEGDAIAKSSRRNVVGDVWIVRWP